MITRKDLADLVLDKSREGEFLLCPVCGNRYSASSGNYFMMGDNDPFLCCDEPLVLAREHKEIEVIQS